MACRILQGVATGATESILPLIIADISFLNERGLLFGAYWGTQNLINAIFTITVSFLVADTNWQRFYWLLRILAVVGTLMVFFIVPETRYNRSPQAIDGQIYHTDEFGVTQAFSVADAERLGIPTDASPDQADVPKLSYWQTLQVFYRPAPGALQVGLGTFGKMVSAMSSPAVVWAVLATSISLGVGISMTLTYGTILTGDFGWSEASVGLVNVRNPGPRVSRSPSILTDSPVRNLPSISIFDALRRLPRRQAEPVPGQEARWHPQA